RWRPSSSSASMRTSAGTSSLSAVRIVTIVIVRCGVRRRSVGEQYRRRPSAAMRRAASGFWIIIAATGCGRDRPKQPPAEMPTEQDAGGVDSAEPVPYPASVPAGWVGENLPPRDVLVRRGACPFEGCQYGEWWSDSATVVCAAARDTTAFAFT